jgi:hypothetical protein
LEKFFFPFHSKETSNAIKKTFYTQNVIITMFSYYDTLSYSKCSVIGESFSGTSDYIITSWRWKGGEYSSVLIKLGID